jgi:hypothetical protein
MARKSISLMLAGILAASMAFALFSCEWTYDYAATVRSYKPFQGEEFGFTKSGDCGTVTDKYVDSPEWKSRSDGGIQYADLKGKLKGSGEEFLMTFRLTPVEGEKGQFLVEPHLLEFDGDPGGAEEATFLLYYMYGAYNGGFDSVQDFLDSAVG